MSAAPAPPALTKALELFDQLVELPEAEQAAALARLQAGDPAVHAQLAALLAADAAADQAWFLRASALADARAAVPAEPAELPRLDGLQLGPWTLETLLGSGGMGQVWRARRTDGIFDGHVAIKMLRETAGDRLADQRFAREGRILARLAHPNIARLLDAGFTAAGQRYLVLEYVVGERIDAYCDQHRLDVRARLRLFRQVCDAVSHAHANLVVHRDLKPSNVLVLADGTVKLLDFGIAKLLEADTGELTQLTQLAGAALTPEYAAPEQVDDGPITTATDVYSLGVLLYRLLCGCRPYGKTEQSPAQLARAIVEAEPVRLSDQCLARPGAEREAAAAAERAAARAATPEKLRRQLQGDLDNIIAKAMKKRPAERYASAQALADDLDRYLAHQPVSARADSLPYRLRKFVVRHRAGVSAGALAAAMVIAGIAGMLWQAQRAFEQEVLARRQSVIADEQRRIAEQQTVLAQQESARANERAAFALAQEELARQQAAAAEHYHRAAQREAARAKAEEAQARAQTTRAEQQSALARAEAAKAQAVKQYLVDIFRTNSRDQRDPEKARQTTVRELLDVGTARIGNQFADQPEVRQELFDVLGTLHYELGALPKAQQLLQERLATLRQLHPKPHPSVAEAWLSLAMVHRKAGQGSQAGKALDEAAAILDALGDRQSVLRADLLAQRAQLLVYSTDRSAARAAATEALRLFERLKDPPAATQRMALTTIGRIAAAEQQWDEAIGAFRQAEQLAAKEFGPQSYFVGTSVFWAARIRRMQGHGAEAEQAFRRALAIFQASLGETHAETREVRAHLGTLLLWSVHRDEGLAMLQQTLEHSRRPDGSDDALAHYIRINLAEYLMVQGRFSDAEGTLAPMITASGRPSSDLGTALLSQARLLAFRGRYAEAQASIERAKSIFSRVGGSNAGVGTYHAARTTAEVRLVAGELPEAQAAIAAARASAHLARGQFHQTSRRRDFELALLEAELQLAQGLAEVALQGFASLAAEAGTMSDTAANRERRALAYLGQGRALLALGRAEAAKPLLERALQQREPNNVAGSPWLAQIQIVLAECLDALGNTAAARHQLELARQAYQAQGPLGHYFTAPLASAEQRLR